ncbi:hypothetical protein IFT64_15530 [Oxalobacteraceae sp. CFBP 8753]|nr:hypothetical protein [Oxalobacteraceae sp. CFBP 8753]
MSDPIIHWNENIPEPNEAVFNALIGIAVKLGDNCFQGIGTGFIFSCGADKAGVNQAVVASAAHVFEQVYRYQNPCEPKPENYFFDPEIQKVDLDPARVFGMLFHQGRSHILRISRLTYDLKSDTAVFVVKKLKPDNRNIFTHSIRLDEKLPSVGSSIEGIGFKHMEFTAEMFESRLVTMFHASLTRRSGTVSEVLERTMRSQGPGLCASFPIFGGMSGGPALRLGTGKAPAAFGILSSDFEEPEDTKYDREKLGSTTVVKLPVSFRTELNGQRVTTFQFLSNDLGTDKNS